MNRAGLLLGMLLAALSSGSAQKAEFIFTSAPFPSAHASTLVELRDASILAAWFGGTAEGKPDVAIWSSVRNTRGWSPLKELAREPNVPCWNPVLFHSADGRLWLYYKFGPSYTWWTAARRYSEDEGRTWSKTEHLPAGVLGPIRAKPLLMPDGTIIAGSSVESYSSWAAYVDRSQDNGESWTASKAITLPGLNASTAPTQTSANGLAQPTGIIQPVIVPAGANHLLLYARATEDIGRICEAESHDGGRTWTAARPMDLRNPNSGIDALRLQDGRFALVYNDTTHGRTPLNLATSRDGEHFHNLVTLESGPGEFSYPALIQTRGGDLLITYTYNRQRIRFVRLTRDLLLARAGRAVLPPATDGAHTR